MGEIEETVSSKVGIKMKDLILRLLKQEVKPAMGCTEPVAIALAAAKVRQFCNSADFEQMELILSANIFKNGLAVGIPGTSLRGLEVAALVGFWQGDAKAGLEVLHSVDESKMAKIDGHLPKVKVAIADTDKKVFVRVRVKNGNGTFQATIADLHDKFIDYGDVRDLTVLQKESTNSDGDADEFAKIFEADVYDLIQEIEKIPASEILFMLDGAKMNEAVAKIGLSQRMGLGVGYTIKELVEEGRIGNHLPMMASELTAAAADVRMSGADIPVMSSNGSGNNGLTAILPLVAYAKIYNPDDEKLAKAVAISHVVNSYIKNSIGRLSPICSCGVSAGASSSAGLVWLMGGNRQQIEGAVKNVFGNVAGMLCDGAKNGCALKLSTAAYFSVASALFASKGTIIAAGDGIIAESLRATIHNLGKVSNRGLFAADRAMIEVMQAN